MPLRSQSHAECQIHGSAAHRIRDDSVKYLFRMSGVANSLGNPLSLGSVVNSPYSSGTESLRNVREGRARPRSGPSLQT